MGMRAFGSIRKLPSKRHQAVYTGPDGRRHRAHTTFLRRSDAEAWLADEERLIDEGRWTPPERRRPNRVSDSPLTVEEYVRTNIETRATRAKRPLKPATVSTYLQGQRLVVFPDLGKIKLADLTPERIRRWWAGLPANPTQNGNAYDLLRSVLDDAVHEGLIPENPVRIKGAGKGAPKRAGRGLTADVLAVYLTAADERYQVPLGVAAWCSLRSGEVRAMRRCDAADDATVLRVEQGVTRVGVETKEGRAGERWVIGEPKTAAGRRTVSVPPIIQPALKATLDSHDASGRGPNDLLFPALDGESPMSDGTFRRAHARALSRIGLEGITLHDLRRTGATLASQAGATIKEVMRRLGHTKPDVAMLYQVADDERDRAVADRMALLAAWEAPPEQGWVIRAEVDGTEHVLEISAPTMAEAVATASEDLGEVQALTIRPAGVQITE